MVTLPSHICHKIWVKSLLRQQNIQVAEWNKQMGEIKGKNSKYPCRTVSSIHMGEGLARPADMVCRPYFGVLWFRTKGSLVQYLENFTSFYPGCDQLFTTEGRGVKSPNLKFSIFRGTGPRCISHLTDAYHPAFLPKEMQQNMLMYISILYSDCM